MMKEEICFSCRMPTESVSERTSDRDLPKRKAALTVREREILTCVAFGDSNKDIAEDFRISPHTVRTHLRNIYRKIGVNTRLRAVMWAVKHLAYE